MGADLPLVPPNGSTIPKTKQEELREALLSEYDPAHTHAPNAFVSGCVCVWVCVCDEIEFVQNATSHPFALHSLACGASVL